MGVLLHGEDEWFGQGALAENSPLCIHPPPSAAGATVHIAEATKQATPSSGCHSNTSVPPQLHSSAPSSPKSHPRTPSPSPMKHSPELQPKGAQVALSVSAQL